MVRNEGNVQGTELRNIGKSLEEMMLLNVNIDLVEAGGNLKLTQSL